jgi:ATP/maltotriose-dependent transcriptional regulator MalT
MIQDGYVAEGRQAFDQLIESAGGIDSPKLREVRSDLLVNDLLLKAHGCEPMTAEAMREIETVMATIDKDDPITEAIVFEFLALAQYWAGQFDRAYDRAVSAARACQRRKMPFVQIYCEVFGALALLERGKFDKAWSSLSDTAELIGVLCGRDDERVLIPKMFMAEILLERGDSSTAASIVLPALDVIEEGTSWFDLFRVAFAVAIATIDGSDICVLLRRAERLSGRAELRDLAGYAGAAALRRAAAERDVARAKAMFDYAPLRAILNAPVHDWRGETAILLAAVDYAILVNDAALANELLARVETELEARRHYRALVRVAIQRATLLWGGGEADAALEFFDIAIENARQMGMKRPFFDHREAVLGMLERKRRSARPHSDAVGAFLAALSDYLTEGQGAALSNLSPREREILHLIADGQTSKEVARQLGVSVNTVMTHRKSIYRKLDVATRSQVITTARTRGLLA